MTGRAGTPLPATGPHTVPLGADQRRVDQVFGHSPNVLLVAHDAIPVLETMKAVLPGFTSPKHAKALPQLLPPF